MRRHIEKNLIEWKQNKYRKVLIIRGARQVGKTYSIRILGKTFPHFVEVNFEETKDVKNFFSGNLEPAKIIEKLSLYYGIPIIENETLLFFDEIQACPDALRSLRFFYEKKPLLHVIAAGSLLEFAISEIASYGVGRIEYCYLYPLSFLEFLEAVQPDSWLNIIYEANCRQPMDEVFHNKLLDILKTYLLTGGMPEVIKCYVNTHNLLTCQKILDDILTTLYDDFSKYKARLPVTKLKEVFKSIVFQTGDKFKYSKISDERADSYKKCLDLLIEAGLAYKIYHTSARGLPLGAQIDDKKFKIALFDLGIYQRVLGLNLSEFIIADFIELINRGEIAELFVYCEMLANYQNNIKPEIFYWHREQRASNAEIDYLVSINDKLIPIEVKAGTKGQMQSMNLFLRERELEYGIRISSENFTRYKNILTIPLYAAGTIWKIFQH